MDIPILKIEDFLVVTIQSELSDDEISKLQEDILLRIKDVGATGLIIDITALDIVDSFMGRTLSNVAATAELLGAKTVVVGIRPAVAVTLVELGIRVKWNVNTALNLERGRKLLKQLIGAEQRGGVS
ncbi:anti-anti-sigma factor [Methanosarcinales archaeon ex4572_44]|nr:MAG: anti-anti-sigma factor [Methanosarcinales archaeon ex4484_138]PHP46230.1 MAG: anti-anti-sigma factor [Methanosarcinales archaeon ex4572_44]RLG25772.1 MAG: anti-anti-sigma factor [Methanosarcinales archaeon]RLG26538.1 MAG: anti-anti-sigma factor [Methanosarcinales archaeon]